MGNYFAPKRMDIVNAYNKKKISLVKIALDILIAMLMLYYIYYLADEIGHDFPSADFWENAWDDVGWAFLLYFIVLIWSVASVIINMAKYLYAMKLIFCLENSRLYIEGEMLYGTSFCDNLDEYVAFAIPLSEVVNVVNTSREGEELNVKIETKHTEYFCYRLDNPTAVVLEVNNSVKQKKCNDCSEIMDRSITICPACGAENRNTEENVVATEKKYVNRRRKRIKYAILVLLAAACVAVSIGYIIPDNHHVELKYAWGTDIETIKKGERERIERVNEWGEYAEIIVKPTENDIDRIDEFETYPKSEIVFYFTNDQLVKISYLFNYEEAAYNRKRDQVIEYYGENYYSTMGTETFWWQDGTVVFLDYFKMTYYSEDEFRKLKDEPYSAEEIKSGLALDPARRYASRVMEFFGK